MSSSSRPVQPIAKRWNGGLEPASTSLSQVGTGIPGRDNIRGGEFTPNRLYLIEGDPGSGKTTLALPFLLEGASLGEKGLHVT